MKINSIKFPLTKKSFLLLCFFACMFVFASFTRKDREKVREFKKELISKWTDKKVDLLEPVNEAKSLGQSLTKENNDFSPASALEFNSKKENGESLNTNNEIAGNSTFYSSKEKEGTIGTFSDKEDDRISDNFFTIDIPTVNKENISAYLEYDLFGLSSHESVSRSINHNIAIGGEIIVPSAEWSHQREAINASLIKGGANSILFTSPAAGVKYKIKNLKVVFEKNNKSGNNLNVSSILSGDQLYVKGSTILSTNLTINNENIVVKNGEFEKVIQLSAQEKANGSFSIVNGGISNTFKIPGTTKSFKIINDHYFNSKGIEISKDKEFNINYEGMKVSVEKETSESAYIEVLKLREKDFPVTSQGLKNITLDNTAYRFSLISGKLNKKVKLTIPYDLKRLGMFSPKEIKVFHFDYTKKEWVMDSSAVVDEKAQTVTVEGDGDNDYINGIISSPESPQLNAFAPTSISGLKAADPMAGNQILSPPTGSQKGDANMNYPIKVPSGLGGLQPSVSIGYSSGGGNGWMGEGWDVQGLSSITIDTRWGSPLFDGATETELYSLDGEMLVYPNGYLPHRHNDKSETDPTITTARQARTSGTKQFYLRKNHDFSIIERLGTGPIDYSWKVTSTNGTKSYYGGSTDSVIRNSDNQIIHWALRMVEDSHGNIMTYSYQNMALNSLPDNNNLKKGVYFHIKQISYGKDKAYTVNFNTQTAISRNDVNVNAKQGAKRVEPYLLTNIDVNYKDQVIRSYQAEYENGQFSKTRLKRMYIRTPGDISKNLIIDDYSFEYYDDVADAQGNVTIFDSDQAITVNNAEEAYGSLTQGVVNPSKINGNTAYEWGLNFRPAVGLNLFYPSNDAYGHIMFGVPFGFSNAEAKNVQQLIDFNGDGIQDMIYRVPNKGLYFSQGSFDPLNNGKLIFSKAEPILNFNSNFSYTKTKSSNWGFDMGLQVWNRGTTNSKSLSITSTYLTDANSDGLMDIVNNGEVWFNKYNTTKKAPEMTKHSEYTENMILKDKDIIPLPYIKTNVSVVEPTIQNIDVIKVWIAPKDGYVRFSDEISAAPSFTSPGGIVPVIPKAIYSVEILNPTNNGNNVRIYLGKVEENSMPAPINITNYNTYSSEISNMPPLDPSTNHLGTANPNRLFVKSGDKILVRLHKSIGTNLEIVSNPTVTYVDGSTGVDIANTPELAQDGFSLNNGSYGNNLFMNNAIAPILLDAPGKVTIKIDPITFPYTTDKFTFDIIKENLVTNVADSLMPTSPPVPISYNQSDVPFTTFDIGTTVPAITFDVLPNEKFLLKFIVKSDSHTSFITTNWNKAIKVEYNTNTALGNTLLKFNAVPQYPSYVVTQFSKKTDIKDPLVNNNILAGVKDYKIEINKNITNFSTLGIGSFYYVIKKGNKVLAKRKITVTVNQGTPSVTEHDMVADQPINGISPVSFFSGDLTQPDLPNNRLINIQVYCNSDGDYALYKKYATYFQNKPFNIYYGSGNTYLIPVVHTSINSTIYNGKTLISNNWGQFLYNALQENTSAAGIADSYGRLMTESIFSDNAVPQQTYPQCNQYANQPDLLYPCIANTMPPTANPQGTGSGQPIIPMKTNVVSVRTGIFKEKWVGTGPDQFSSKTSFKDDDETASYSTSPIADAPEITPGTLTTGASPSLDTTMKAIDKKQSSQSINKTSGGSAVPANGGNSETTLNGQGSVEIQNFMDLNGDGYPDIVYPDAVQLTNPAGSLEENPFSFTLGSFLTDSYSKQKTKSASFSYSSFSAIARGDVFGSLGITTTAGNSMGWSGDVSAGITSYDLPESTDYGKTFWLDLNGDGLPDKISGGGSATMYYELNLGKKLFNGQPFTNLKTYQSHPIGAISASIGGGLGGTTNLQSLGNFGFGVNASLGASSSIGSADVLYEDINGDGMIDILEVNNSNTSVRYNLGNRFDDSKPLLKTGSSIDFTNETQSYNGSLTFGGSFMFNIGPIFIVPIFPVLTLYIKAGLSGSANFGINISDTKKSFKDMNGDGFVDMIRDSSTGFTVNYSRIGRTNKLKTVTNNITQGKYTLDYQFSKPTYLDPHAKLVVKEIKVLNPDVFSTNYTNSDTAKDIVTRYRFEDSKYDRRERDNFGFSKMVREEMNGGTVYRKLVDLYHNNNYFLAGMLKESQVMTAANTMLSGVKYEYIGYKFKDNITQLNTSAAITPIAVLDAYDTGGKEGRKMASVFLLKKTNINYETGGQMQTTEQMTYNNKGLLSIYKYTSPSNVYNSQILYWTGIGSNMIAIPKQIDVYEGITNAVRIRQRKTLNVNSTTGDIGKFVVFDGTDNIETDYTYDSYGNVQSVLYPPNEYGQRYSLNYQYDVAATNKYVTSVTDNYGVSSSAEYSPLYDAVTKSTDITGNVTEYTYDGFGRTNSIKGPNEAGMTTPTIMYSYDFANYGIPNTNQAVKIFMAQTAHYDSGNPSNLIKTNTYADFTGRVIQVKKDIEVDGVERRSVSGRTIYDPLGRVTRQYHPKDEPLSAQNTVNLTTGAGFSTSSVYDTKDRAIEETDEDSKTKYTNYIIESGLLKTTEKFETMKSETFTNTEGQIVSKNDYLNSSPLKTTYEYNKAGELLKTIDPFGIPTIYNYNLAGRRINMSHPDKGKTSYQYDGAGNLIRLWTDNLANDPNISVNNIHYKYHYNRLTDIELPDLPNGANPNNVHYEYLNSGNGTGSGRLFTKSDGTGSTIYSYGKMGEITSENRTVFGYNIPTMNFKTDFSYDSWNRIKQIVYPDGEQVSYKYDLGGNLKSVSNSSQDYIKNITYDLYEQRKQIVFGNGMISNYGYMQTNRRMASSTLFKTGSSSILSNSYSYDPMGNITKLINFADVSQNGMGGGYYFTYVYDTLNRLIGTEGSQRLVDKGGDPITPGVSPYPESNSGFKLIMKYNDFGGIATKTEQHNVNQQANTLNTYSNTYNYVPGTHKVKAISDATYGNTQSISYDFNGNVTSHQDEFGTKKMAWDEQDRLKAFYSDDSGVYQYYAYDDKGERTIKYGLRAGSQLYQNGVLIDPGTMSLYDYKLYPNPYVVVTSNGQYTKNYFEGSTRFASRINDGTDIFIPTTTKSQKDASIKEPNPELDFKTYLSKAGVEEKVSLELAGKNSGWQTGLYYLHTDHLGTASFVTNDNAETTQFFLNLPFGETMIEQQTGVYNNPYKFNAKELDKETGLYYYGARYYNPRLSVWYGVDPLAEEFPSWSPYNYTFNNPIRFTDPDGRAPLTDYKLLQNGKVERVNKNDGTEKDSTDTLYSTDKNGNMQKNNKITMQKGIIGQLQYSRDGNKSDGYPSYHQAIKEYTSQTESDVSALFYFAADNAKNVEFSLTDFNIGNKRFISTQTYNIWEYSPGMDQIGVKSGQENRLTHNHPGNDTYSNSFTERNSMGEKVFNGKTQISGDYYNVRNGNGKGKSLNYPYRTYFPGSKNLYNITPQGIKLISKDLK